MRFKLYTKFMIAMIAISVVPVTLVGVRLIGINQRGIEDAVLELHLKLAGKISQNVENYLQTTDEKVRFTINVLRMNIDWSDKQALLQSLIETHAEIEEVSIISPSGREALKVFNPAYKKHVKLVSYGKDPDFIKARKTSKKAVRMEPGTDGPGLVVLYYPFHGGFILRVGLVLRDLWDQIQEERVGGSGFAIITDNKGIPIAYPQAKVAPEILAQVPSWPIVKDALRALAIGSSEYTDSSGIRQVGAYSPILSLGGAVIIQQPRDEAYSASIIMKKQAVWIVLFFGFLALLLAYLMSKQLSSPILELTRKAEIVAGGDFSQRVNIKSRDELKDLADTFNRMTSQLKNYSDLQVDRIIVEQKKTEAILFSIADGIIMTDYQGRIQLANRKARDVFGLKDSETIEGRVFTELLDDPQIKAVIDEVSRNPKEGIFKDFEISTGQTKQVFQCSSLPVIAPEKQANIGVVTAIHDVTLERELAKIKEEFLHSITHDLRNPMGAIRGFLEFLLKEVPGPLTGQQRKMLVSVDRASYRLLGMINNILDVAKMESGKFDLKLGLTSIRDIAGRVFELLQPLAQRKNIKFELDSPARIEVNADSELVERTFVNLIGNAIKFSPDNGKITVHLTDSPDKVSTCIEDTGDGIPSEYLKTIFDKFAQVKGQVGGGSGLGLTICKYVADAHLGRIWVESEVGKGSRFYFEIPKNLMQNESGGIIIKKGP